MNARELFVVLLRVVGLFFLLWAIEGLPVAVGQAVVFLQQRAFLQQSAGGPQAAWYMVWMVSYATTPIVRAIVGFVLLVSAPRIGSWFYPHRSEETEPPNAASVGAGDVYRVASFLLGAYMLVLAVPPAARVATVLMGDSRTGPGGYGFLPDLVQACVFSVCAVGFMFGASGIAQLLERLRYDPEKVPPRQFSLRLLLLILVGVALILGLIRYFVQ